MKDEIKEILDMLKQHISIVSVEDEDLLLDYITNLQEENERLKNGYCELKVKCNNGECDCTHEEYESMIQANIKGSLLLDDYKTRNEKATEYIKEKSEEVELSFYGFPDKITSFKGSVSTLLKILKGE